MENSLTLQSRRLIEKLNLGKGLNLQDKVSNGIDDISPINNLLFNSNNLRQYKGVHKVKEHSITDSYPKSSITSIIGRSAYLSKSENSLSNVSSVTSVSDDMPKRVPFGVSQTSEKLQDETLNFKTLKNADLLGYDWIVGMLENKSKESQLDKPPEYFEELDKFRRTNKQFCISSDSRELSQSNPISQRCGNKNPFHSSNYDLQHFSQPDTPITINEQPQIYAYTLNERLFPVPLDMETAERGPADSKNPHIIKISIPSNRFIHRNQKFLNVKDKNSLMKQNHPTIDNIGESLSLSSHCQSSGKISQSIAQNDKFTRSLTSARQEPAGLIGNLISQSLDIVGNLQDNVAWFGHSQPKTEQEAIEQLKRGKIGAKLSRTIPSSLEHRSFNIESLQTPLNICQTRIVLRDMIDDSNPRESKSFSTYNANPKPQMPNQENQPSEVPRFAISRKEMSKVYLNEIQNVSNNAPTN